MTRVRLVTFAVLACAVGSHAAAEPKKEDRPAGPKVPEELAKLNAESRALYRVGREAEVAAATPLVFQSGDELVLKWKGERKAVTVIPPEYHSLKSYSHASLGLFTFLTRQTDKPLADESVARLKEYRKLISAAGDALEKCGFDAETAARQKKITARNLDFLDRVLKDGTVSAADLTSYCRSSRPDVMANAAQACRAQLRGTHAQMMKWKAGFTPAEWDALVVVVQGGQTPRVSNAATQYFARLLGVRGEGRRLVYAESLWDEDKATNLMGTIRLDGKVAVAFFNDPDRMYRDILEDSAREVTDELLAAP